jgi:aminoglycoside phosphotransferase (APT) family kinase protein
MTTLDDFDGLLAWGPLQDWVAAQPGIPGDGPVTAVEQLTGGSQNNIFLLTRADGTRSVLRRPPQHLRKNSNDTMLREARVLAAIADTDVPHPAFYAACDDLDVIGVCFYVMAPIEGFTPMGPLPGGYGTDPAWRRKLALELVDGAAKLGAVDHEAVGLGDFGKPEQWIERQVGRWRSQLDGYSQLEGYGKPDIPDVDRVGAWLDANRPAEAHIGIIHGDYQFANVMFAPDAPRLAAIVDWELSTLGDPLLDLGWVLTSWVEPGDPPGKDALLQPWDGMPTRAELVGHYAEVSGRDVSAMPWYFVMACYKLGILLEGTHARACAGQAPAAMGDIFHGMTLWLFARANQSISEA